MQDLMDFGVVSELLGLDARDEKRNRLAGIYGAVKDVTRRKQAEAETQATYDTLNAFVDSVPAFGAFVDTEERYQFVNRYHENWFKDSRTHFVGRRLAEVHRPSTYAVMRPYSLRALAGPLAHLVCGEPSASLSLIAVTLVPAFSSLT